MFSQFHTRRNPNTELCEELSVPLKIVSNLIDLASNEAANEHLSENYLAMANERLERICQVLAARCSLGRQLRETAF